MITFPGSEAMKGYGGLFYPLRSAVNREIWLSIWPVSLSDTGGLDPDWVQTALTSSQRAVTLPPLPPPRLTSPPSLPCEGGVAELSSTRYWEWYKGLCIWSPYCLGCGEVIQWHFNRLSAFFAVALVLIWRIKTRPVRHWTCGLAKQRRVVASQWEQRRKLPCMQVVLHSVAIQGFYFGCIRPQSRFKTTDFPLSVHSASVKLLVSLVNTHFSAL